MIASLWKSLTRTIHGSAKRWRTSRQVSCLYPCSKKESKYTSFHHCKKFVNIVKKRLPECGMRFAALATRTTITWTSRKSFGISKTKCSRHAKDALNKKLARNAQFGVFRAFCFCQKNVEENCKSSKVFSKNLLEFINIYVIMK